MEGKEDRTGVRGCRDRRSARKLFLQQSYDYLHIHFFFDNKNTFASFLQRIQSRRVH